MLRHEEWSIGLQLRHWVLGTIHLVPYQWLLWRIAMSGATELITFISVMRNVCRDALRWSANLHVETRDQEAMIRPTVICSKHGSCDRHLFSVFCSCKDIVEQTPEHCCKHFKTNHVILSLLDGKLLLSTNVIKRGEIRITPVVWCCKRSCSWSFSKLYFGFLYMLPWYL